MKKSFEKVTKSHENTSQDITKNLTENAIKNSKELEILKKNKILEIKNDRGLLASYLMSPLSKIVNLESTIQFKLGKDSSSNRVNDLKIHNSKPFTLRDNLLTFRDTRRVFEIKGDLLEMITNIIKTIK